ncbi:hypothetical protein CRE_16361 [Caenorhabditis remanei]|uniref:Uncharacterized protein n=1 Tax=Caenorhabditis remanei TaxID=31234 RepID=E3NF97_CAERE|nr:hypothetical protein CRE_16361 [Caenorhabditis remanei]
MQIFKLLISYYFINYARGSSKTSAETGNDIEKFLLESNSVKELSPKNTEMSALNNKKPDKFMEDLIEVQRTYRSLKEKWQRMMEEKNRVIQMASSTTPPTTTSATSSEVQVIDVDVFEAPEKFQDISSDSEFDDESFMDISMTSSTSFPSSPVSTTTTVSQLDQIQTAIREAFGGVGAKVPVQKEQKISQPSLFEIIGSSSSTTTTTSTTTKPVTLQQMDATITTIKIDQSPPPRPTVAAGVSTLTLDTVARNQQVPELTMLNVPRPRHRPAGNVIPQDHPGPSTMDGTQIMAGVNSGATTQDVQSAPAMSQVVPAATEASPVIPTVTQVAQAPLASEGNSKSLLSTFGGRPPAPFPKVATPWRHPAPTMDSLDTANDPFDTTTRVTPPTTTSESPTTSLPLHILPTSSFHSSGTHPDAQPATNLFRYPDQVKIPFFGAKTEEDSGETTVHPMRPTTPEPFRSEEIQNLEEVENEDGDMTLAEDLASSDAADSDLENTESELEENGEIEESEFDGDEEIDEITEATTTPRGIEQNEDYVEETFSQEKSSEASNLKIPESFGIGKAPAPPMDPSPGLDVFGSPPGSQKPRPKAFGTLPSSSGPTESEIGGFGSPPGSSGPKLGSFGNSAPSFPTDDIFGSPPGSGSSGPQGPSGLSSTFEEQIIDSDSAPSFGIGRSPPGFSQPIGPTLPPAAQPQKPGVKFPTLVEQVESFFNEDGSSVEDTGASSALGSFASAEQVANVPVSQNIQVLDDPKPVTRPPTHMPTSRNPVGIFGTKLKTINERAYKPPMFPSALSSETVKMTQLGNPYQQRTTVLPIGPHGLAEPAMEVNSADTELPAWGVEK